MLVSFQVSNLHFLYMVRISLDGVFDGMLHALRMQVAASLSRLSGRLQKLLRRLSVLEART